MKALKRIDHFRVSVWNDNTLTSSEKLLLQALACWMDFDSLGNCRPGHAKLSTYTGLSTRHLSRTIASVIEKGWLVEVKRGSSGKGQRREASVYCGAIPDYRHGVTSTTDMVSEDYRHGGYPPSQGPGDPHGAGAPGSPEPTSRSRGKHPKGCTCYRCTYGNTGMKATPASTSYTYRSASDHLHNGGRVTPQTDEQWAAMGYPDGPPSYVTGSA